MDIDLMPSMIEEGVTTKQQVLDMFGKPLQVKQLTKTQLLGYRKMTSTMNAWSLVPFVGLVAGGVDERFNTCILKLKVPYEVVERIDCNSVSKFHSNAETFVGHDLDMTKKMDIFGLGVISNTQEAEVKAVVVDEVNDGWRFKGITRGSAGFICRYIHTDGTKDAVKRKPNHSCPTTPTNQDT